MAVINNEGPRPGINNKGKVPTATSLLKGAGVTMPVPGVNTDGMEPTANSLIEGARKASENLPPLTKTVSTLRLKKLRELAHEKGWTRQELDEAIRNERL